LNTTARNGKNATPPWACGLATLESALSETVAVEPLRPGKGSCAFVVVSAKAPG